MKKVQLTLSIDPKQWTTLAFEAKLMAEVFGHTITTKQLANTLLDIAIRKQQKL